MRFVCPMNVILNYYTLLGIDWNFSSELPSSQQEKGNTGLQ